MSEQPILELDSSGNVAVKPVTGWTTGTVAGIAVLLGIQYAETPEALGRGDNNQIQFVLTPQLSLDLAEKLTTLANKVIGDQSHSARPAN
jgi:hypothetical protein